MFWVAGRLQQHRWQGFMLSMLSINRGNRLDSVEKVEVGEEIDSSERQQILRLSVSRRKEVGDVAQLVRALPCHRLSLLDVDISFPNKANPRSALIMRSAEK